jgi:hypothetical protein
MEITRRAYNDGAIASIIENDPEKFKHSFRLTDKSIAFAEDAIKADKSWIKGSVHLLRGLAYHFRRVP